MINRRIFKVAAAATFASFARTSVAFAQDVRLRLHQFLPPPSTIPAKILVPWAEANEEGGGGRMKGEH